MTRAAVFVLLLTSIVLPAPAAAQRGADLPRYSLPSSVQVRVMREDDQRVSDYLRVQLMKIGGTPVAESLANDGMALFSDVPPGDYYLHITGVSIQETNSPTFSILPGMGESFQMVYVKSRTEAKPVGSAQGTVSTQDLNIPGKAKKEFDKGVDALQHSDLKKAGEHLDKAIALYPEYAAAYNDLGVIAIKQKDLPKAKAAFSKAIELNDPTGSAYLNLGRLNLMQRDFQEAATMINKSLALNPSNPEAMALLANCQLAGGHLDEAIATARRVHAIPHERFAVIHLIAAAALEKENNAKEASAEYELFLKEDPNSPRADQARKALKRLSAQAASEAPKPE